MSGAWNKVWRRLHARRRVAGITVLSYSSSKDTEVHAGPEQTLQCKYDHLYIVHTSTPCTSLCPKLPVSFYHKQQNSLMVKLTLRKALSMWRMQLMVTFEFPDLSNVQTFHICGWSLFYIFIVYTTVDILTNLHKEFGKTVSSHWMFDHWRCLATLPQLALFQILASFLSLAVATRKGGWGPGNIATPGLCLFLSLVCPANFGPVSGWRETYGKDIWQAEDLRGQSGLK